MKIAEVLENLEAARVDVTHLRLTPEGDVIELVMAASAPELTEDERKAMERDLEYGHAR